MVLQERQQAGIYHFDLQVAATDQIRLTHSHLRLDKQWNQTRTQTLTGTSEVMFEGLIVSNPPGVFFKFQSQRQEKRNSQCQSETRTQNNPSIYFLDLLVPELRVTEVSWVLFQLSWGEGRVTRWTSGHHNKHSHSHLPKLNISSLTCVFWTVGGSCGT